MNPTEELVSIRRRIGGVEHELEQLKRRVGAIEHQIAEEALGTARFNAVAPAPLIVEPPPVPVAPPPLVEQKIDPPVLQAPEVVPAEVFRAPPPLRPHRAPEPSWLEQARPWLEQLQVWPPSGGGSKEVQLGAWWATRLGILFAVIGAVFFGVYVSLNTAPWIKLAELATVAAGVIGLGGWLERKTPRFGQVVFAGGLALAFFTAMAAYTVPAVKVIDNRLVAALWQLAVTAGIGAVAWRKQSPTIATMAVLLGYVAAWFSFSGGLQLFALASALVLAVTAVAWKRWLAWEAPSIVALGGYWAIYGTLLAGLGTTGHVPLPLWVWGSVVAGFAVFFWRDDGDTSSARAAWVQNANSTAALALGWLTAWLAFPAQLGIFYATAAVVLGAAAWRRASTRSDDAAGAVLLAKSLGALTLAVIKWTGPEWTALALIVQAGVMVATNRRLHSAVIAAGSGIVATVALCFWGRETLAHSAAVLSLPAVGRGLTLVALLAWGLELARDSGLELADEARRSIARVVSGVSAVMALVFAQTLMPEAWLPAWCVAGAALLVGAGALWRRSEPWLAGAAVLLGAHVALWSRLGGVTFHLEVMWANALLVLGPTVVAAWWLGRDAKAERPQIAAWWVSALALVSLGACVCVGHGATASLLVGLGLAVALALAAPEQAARRWLWLAAWALGVGVIGHLVATLAHRGTAGGEGARWAVALVALIGPAALAAWSCGRAQLAAESPRGGVAGIMIGVGLLFSLVVAVEAGESLVVTGFAVLASALLAWRWDGAYRTAAWLLWLVALAWVGSAHLWPDVSLTLAAVWGVALGWSRSAGVCERWKAAGANVELTTTVQTWLAGLIAAVAILSHAKGEVQVAWFAGASALAIVVARLGFPAVVEVATGFAVGGLAQAALLVTRRSLEISNLDFGFGAVVAMAVVATVLARTLPEGALWASPARREVRAWGFPAAGLSLVFGLMLAQLGELRPYITVGWGVAALAWFGFGLFARTRPDRLLGLIGLALCVPRVFLVDLHSTLYRIVAFGALGAVLLWVGFSYHRFRHLIADDVPSPDGPDKKL